MSDTNQAATMQQLTEINPDVGQTFHVGGCVWAQIIRDRQAATDGGPTGLLIVKGDDGSRVETVRLDIFRKRPHRHVNQGLAECDVEVLPGESLGQTLARFYQPNSVLALMEEAGYEYAALEITGAQWDAASKRVAEICREVK